MEVKGLGKFTYNDIISISKNEINYIQKLNNITRFIRFYNNVQMITEYEGNIEKFITIIYGRENKKWTKV